MQETISAPEVFEVLRRSCEELSEKHIDEFRKLDAAIGDGDLGITVRKGCQAIVHTLRNTGIEDIGVILSKCGADFNRANPSTFGILAGSAFIESGKYANGKTVLDLGDIAKMFRASLEGVIKRGKAKAGEKTMLDALEPAVISLERSATESKSIPVAFTEAASEAAIGLEKTKEMEAKKGRARAFGNRTIGEQDPGATVVYYFLKEIATALNGQNEKG